MPASSWMASLSQSKSLWIFLCAVLGSGLVELVFAHQILEANKKFPARYRKPIFWVVRCLLAVGSGFLALIFEVPSGVLALQMGVTAPAVITAMTRNSPELPRELN